MYPFFKKRMEPFEARLQRNAVRCPENWEVVLSYHIW